MKNTEQFPTIETRVTSITCDICKKEINAGDVFEFQEIISLNIEAGYGSIFGDGNTYELDICQHCVESVLGKYLRKTGNYIYGDDYDYDAASKLADKIDEHESYLDYDSPDTNML